MIGVGVIGYGYWGPNLVRNFWQTDGCEVRWVLDHSQARLDMARRQYPAVVATTSFDEVLADPQVQAVAIATPTRTHFPFALRALEAGKHVLVEKPMTSNSDEGRRLVEEAKRSGQ